MLPFNKAKRTMVVSVVLAISAVFGCSDSIGVNTPAVHGSPTGAVVGPASSVSISPSSLMLDEGGTGALQCTVLDAAGISVSTAPSWQSSDTTVVVVNSRGNVVARHAGTALASCEMGGRVATSAITVTGRTVAYVEVSPGAGTLTSGGSLQLAGVPRDSLGLPVPGYQVQWSSADSGVVSVSASGLVVAKSSGVASVVASSAGKVGFTKINVGAKAPSSVAAISLSVDQTSIKAGRFMHATATTTDESGQVLNGRSITWSVGDSRVLLAATLNATRATVTGLAEGTSTLTATCEGQSATATITVTAGAVQTITVVLSPSSVLIGQTAQASATLRDALGNMLTNRAVTWTSLDSSIATVSSTGVVTGIRAGAVIIRATSEGQTGDGTFTVVPPPVATVTSSLASTSLAPGQTTQATAVARDASGNVLSGRYVAWTSLSPNIASVSISGVVTAVAAGTAVIRATVESKTGDASLTVSATAAPIAVASVTASVAADSLVAGQSTQAVAVARDANGNVLTGRTVSWSCLTPTVATVTPAGVVTAISAGTATIRATVETKTGDASLVAKATATTPTAMTTTVVVLLDSTNLAPGHSAMAHAVAKDQLGNVLTGKTASWQSATPSVATVSSTGQLTAVSSGVAPIQATVDGVLGQASVTVTAPLTSPTGPAPAPSPGHPNEPAGFTQLSPTLVGDIVPPTQDQYVAGSSNEIGWINGGGITKVIDSTTSALQINFPAGMIGGGAPGKTWTYSSTNPQNWPQHPKAIYQSFWYKLSPNFPVNLTANKVLYSNIGGGNKVSLEVNGGADYRLDANGNVVFDPNHATAYTAAIFPCICMQGIVTVDSVVFGNANLQPTQFGPNPVTWPQSAQVRRGVWHHFEVLYTANTVGHKDGGAKLWLDGQLITDFTNRIQWSATADYWMWTSWWPVYGGGGQVPTDAVNPYHRLKDFYVSGK
jgi:uncharacterized protein YjdB